MTDDRILYQTIEGSIRDGMRDGFNALAETGPDLRDQFAMAALTGLMADPETGCWDQPYNTTCGVIARRSFVFADAMLKEREKPVKETWFIAKDERQKTRE